MLGKITSLLILALLWPQGVSTSSKAPTYEDEEAYEVYSAILPLEWPLREAHAKSLIIQKETKGYEMCLRPEKEGQEKIGPAISDYVRLNAKPSLLQPRIKVGVPYQLIVADELESQCPGLCLGQRDEESDTSQDRLPSHQVFLRVTALESVQR